MDLIGSNIDGKYQVLSLLGEGGLSTVFKAAQPALNRFVAIKVLHDSELSDVDSLSRFEREARILATLEHEHILRMYSFGVLGNGSRYMAIEYLEGKTLLEVLQSENQLSWQRTVHIGTQVCSALALAHKKKIIHRDLKPANIMLLSKPEPDFVKVLDFGLSTMQSSTAAPGHQKLTQTGMLVGSIHYMSPEICGGEKVDERSDVYALGCILYECIAGKPALDADNPIAMLHKHRTELPQPLSAAAPESGTPSELELVIFKAMQKDPTKRFQSMSEFLRALTLFAQGKANELTLAGISLGAKEKEEKKGISYKLLIFGMAAAAVLNTFVLLAAVRRHDASQSLGIEDSQPIIRRLDRIKKDIIVKQALVDHCTDKSARRGLSETLFYALMEEGAEHNNLGEWRQAEDSYRRAISVSNRDHTQDGEERADVVLAETIFQAKDRAHYGEGETCADRAIEIMETNELPNKPFQRRITYDYAMRAKYMKAAFLAAKGHLAEARLTIEGLLPVVREAKKLINPSEIGYRVYVKTATLHQLLLHQQAELRTTDDRINLVEIDQAGVNYSLTLDGFFVDTPSLLKEAQVVLDQLEKANCPQWRSLQKRNYELGARFEEYRGNTELAEQLSAKATILSTDKH